MEQFYIFEIKKNAQGEYEHSVDWAYDKNGDIAQRKGESKYYAVLSRAAISDMEEHSAILFSAKSFPIMNKHYEKVVPDVQEEPVEETGEGE